MADDPAGIVKGSIYILRKCRPMHGEERKDRPVIVVAPIPRQGKLLVVAISSSVKSNVRDRIQLPDKKTDPQATTGLERPSSAVPAWYGFVTPERLGQYKIGQLEDELRLQVTNAALDRIEARFPSVRMADE